MSDDERVALAGLLGGAFRGQDARVELSALDEALREGPLGVTLTVWLTTHAGPLRDRPAEASGRRARLAAAEAALDASRHRSEPWFASWIEGLQARGTLGRLDTRNELRAVAPAVAVLDRLPTGGIPRMQLAVETTGDPKALEDGAIRGLVLDALRCWFELDRSDDADAVRALWEAAGVVSEDLSSQVLALGLRPNGGDPLCAWLRAAADLAHPVVLTLRDVARLDGWTVADVFVCENPSVLRQVAAQVRPVHRAMLCTHGRPHAAFWRLAASLVASGCRLHVHADFDPVGLDIVRQIAARTGAAPWLMDARSYTAGLRADSPAWHGALAVRAPWDPDLEAVMQSTRRAVYEEAVVQAMVEAFKGERP